MGYRSDVKFLMDKESYKKFKKVLEDEQYEIDSERIVSINGEKFHEIDLYSIKFYDGFPMVDWANDYISNKKGDDDDVYFEYYRCGEDDNDNERYCRSTGKYEDYGYFLYLKRNVEFENEN